MEIQGIPGLLSAVGDVKQNKDYVQVSVSVFYVKGDRRAELFSREQTRPFVEAYDSRPDDFFKFMRGEGYDLNNEQIKELVDSSR